MITNISRQLATGTVAIAASVAALSFAGAAQAASMIAVGGNATAGSWGTTNPTLTPGTTTGLVGTPTGEFAGLGFAAVSVLKAITLIGTPPMTPIPVSHTFTNPSPIIGFASINVGGGMTVAITPTISTGVYNSMMGMKTTNYNVMGSAFFDYASPTSTDEMGIFNLTVTSVGPGWIYNLILEKGVFAAVPEPSAILGILAVAGVGAFARRKS
jgi:hypothetical protein